MTRAELIQFINANIYPNGRNQITAPMVRDSILAVVGFLGDAAVKDIGAVLENNTDLVTGGAVYDAIRAYLSSVMKMVGETTTDVITNPTANPVYVDGEPHTAQKGDVVVYGYKEFWWTGSIWKELGDEASWALKTITITGTGDLTGGGTLEANRTLDLTQSAKDKLAHGETAFSWLESYSTNRLRLKSPYSYLNARKGLILEEETDYTNTPADFVKQVVTVGETEYTILRSKLPIVSDSFISAGGISPGGGASGTTLQAVWDSLTTNTGDYANAKIHSGHIPFGSGLGVDGSGNIYVTSQGTVTGIKIGSTTYTPSAGSTIVDISSGIPTSMAWSAITSTPTTLAGYGITDAKIESGVITLGSSTITPLTSHQTIYNLVINNSAGTAQITYKPNVSGTYSLTLTSAMVGLGNVENTALSTWAGTSNITTLGTISTGVWQGTAIGYNYVAAHYIGRTRTTASAAQATLLGIDAISNASSSGSSDASRIVWDSTNNAWHFLGGIYADSFISAGGLSSGGGTSGIDLAAMWASLQNNDNESTYDSYKFAAAHLPACGSNLSYTTDSNGLATGINVDLSGYIPYTDPNAFYHRGTAATISNFVPGQADLQSVGTSTGNYLVQCPNSSGQLVQFSSAGSTAILQLYTFYAEGLYWRNSTDYSLDKPWRLILDSTNYSTLAMPLTGVSQAAKVTLTRTNDNEVLALDSPYSATWLNFNLSGSHYGQIGVNSSYDLIYRNTYDNIVRNVLHSGNYSSYALPLAGGTMSNTDLVTNLNADLLDGQHGSYYAAASSLADYLPLAGGVSMTNDNVITNLNADLLDGVQGSGYFRRYINNGDFSGSIPTSWDDGLHIVHWPNVEYSSVLVGHDYGGRYWQLYFQNDYGSMKFRSSYDDTWRRIYADNYHPNADTLSIGRYLWGNYFNGSGDIGGDIVINGINNVSYSTTLCNSEAYGLKIKFNNGNTGAFFQQDNTVYLYNHLIVSNYVQAREFCSSISDRWSDGTYTHPAYGLDFQNLVDSVYLNGYYGVKVHTAGGVATFDTSCNFYTPGAITAGAASDFYLKQGIVSLDILEAKVLIMNTRPVSFYWNEKAKELGNLKGREMGVVAQEAEKIIPWAISPIWQDYLRVDYTKYIPAIVRVEQDLLTTTDNHETRIQQLERESREKDAKIAELENRLARLTN